MAVQSKSQKFANAVFPRVQAISQGDSAGAVKYKTIAKKAGSLVRNSGLMQTLAFFQAKGQKEPHFKTLASHLTAELSELNIIPTDTGSLFDHVRASSVPQYMYLTRETLHLLNWHKRLADTLIIKDEKEEMNDD